MVRNHRKTAAIWAGASVLALLLSVSAFADSRPQNESSRHQRDRASAEQSGHGRRDRSSDQALTNRNNEHRPSDNGRVDRNRAYDNNRVGGDRQRVEANQSRRSDMNRDFRGQQRNDTGQYRNDRRSSNQVYRNDAQYRNEAQRSDGRYRNDGQYRSEVQRNDGRYRNDRQYRNDGRRNDGRISGLGRIRSFSHERGGYRIYLDRGNYSYWIPEARLLGRRLAVGLSLRLGGIFRGGLIDVDLLGWPGDSYYNDPYYNDSNYNDRYYAGDGYGYGATDEIRGVVERVDYQSGTLLLRDEYRGGIVTVDMRSIDRRSSRLDFDDMRPGDRVTLSGSWLRGGYFSAMQVDADQAY
jgi:hypothetical protein